MIRIVTDSAADLERWQLEEMNIGYIPLGIMFGETEYKDGVELSKDRFYELLLGGEDYPKTSQASPQVLLDLIEEAKAAGDPIIYITLSSALSGTYQSAVMTARMSGYDQVYIIDSRNATGGQQLLVRYAAKLRDEGKSAGEIVASVEALRSRITLYACIDTLEYLYRGGRISRAVYTVGNLAQIKPIIHVDAQGAVAIPAKVMGMRKGMATLGKRLELQEPDPEFPVVAMYTNKRQVAQTMAKLFETMGYPVSEDQYIQVGAAIGAHIGPDACGVVYVAKE